MEEPVSQITLFDLDFSFGKMCPEPSPHKAERISKRCLKKPSELQTAPYLYLDLREGYGNLLGAFWEMNSHSLGEYSMLNTGVSPKDAKESFLWQILEDTPRLKYYLSKTACLGILRRAKSRDKELPEQLKTALEIQAGIRETEITDKKNSNEIKSNLNRLSGTLIAAQDTQTFTTKPMICLNDQGGNRMDITQNITSTLRTSMGGNLPIVVDSQQGNKENSENLRPITTGTSANNRSVLFDNHAKDCRYNGPLKVAPTVAAAYGTGGNNVPLFVKPVAYSLDSKNSNSMKSDNPNSGCRETDKARTIDTSNSNPSKNQGGIAIVQESYCIAGNTINRQVKNGGNGQGVQKNISYTLTTNDVHAILKFPYQDIVGTLCHRDYKGVNSIYVNQDKCVIDRTYQNVVGTLCTGDYKGANSQYISQNKCIIDNATTVFGESSFADFDEGISTLRASGGTNGGGSENLAVSQNLVRRLTPLECERLQGFPDGWSLISEASDSSRYKALGNSVAIPCVNFVLRGIAYFLQKIKDESEES